MDKIFESIRAERKRQDDKWGAERHLNSLYWLGILMEEVGEVAKALIELNEEHAEIELVQCAAVIVCWLEQYQSERTTRL